MAGTQARRGQKVYCAVKTENGQWAAQNTVVGHTGYPRYGTQEGAEELVSYLNACADRLPMAVYDEMGRMICPCCGSPYSPCECGTDN